MLKKPLGIISVIIVICAVIFVFFGKKTEKIKNVEPTQTTSSKKTVETTGTTTAEKLTQTTTTTALAE